MGRACELAAGRPAFQLNVVEEAVEEEEVMKTKAGFSPYGESFDHQGGRDDAGFLRSAVRRATASVAATLQPRAPAQQLYQAKQELILFIAPAVPAQQLSAMQDQPGPGCGAPSGRTDAREEGALGSEAQASVGGQILLRTPAGVTCILEIGVAETVEDVKAKIQRRTGFPPDMQRLICAGRQVGEEGTLWSHGVRNGSTIQLALRYRGGSFRGEVVRARHGRGARGPENHAAMRVVGSTDRRRTPQPAGRGGLAARPQAAASANGCIPIPVEQGDGEAAMGGAVAPPRDPPGRSARASAGWATRSARCR